MSRLNIRQHQALRYASIKTEGDREIRSARRNPSSTASLQRFIESPQGVTVMLILGLFIFALMAPVGIW